MLGIWGGVHGEGLLEKGGEEEEVEGWEERD